MCKQIGKICDCHYTNRLSAKILEARMNISALTVAELLQMQQQCDDEFNLDSPSHSDIKDVRSTRNPN
ncbi:MAG: hypothetical protein GY862_06860 [Gammaproteobacteria bacterium]|nr:hypothetical protein [Gammaproteobacteria bacterium]